MFAALPLLLMANAGVVEATGESATAASRRLVGLMLAGFRAAADDIAAPVRDGPGIVQRSRDDAEIGD